MHFIRAPKIKKYLTYLQTSNPYIGTLDLETYDQYGLFKVYSIGFYTRIQVTKIFYVDPISLDYHKIITECIYSMLLSKVIHYTYSQFRQFACSFFTKNCHRHLS